MRPLSMTILLGKVLTDSLPGDLFSTDRQVSASAVETAEQILAEVPGGGLGLLFAVEAVGQALPDEFGLGDARRLSRFVQTPRQLVIQANRNSHGTLVYYSVYYTSYVVSTDGQDDCRPWSSERIFAMEGFSAVCRRRCLRANRNHGLEIARSQRRRRKSLGRFRSVSVHLAELFPGDDFDPQILDFGHHIRIGEDAAVAVAACGGVGDVP